MRTLYDTTTIHPLDRFEHYREGALRELAPVEVDGRTPGRLVAAMLVSRVGVFDLEELAWEADTEVGTRRTPRLIRICDPERFRLIMPIAGELRLEQAGHPARFGPGDIGLFDLSRPWRAVHPVQAGPIRVAMLTFPRALLPFDERAVAAILGTVTPRGLRARDLTAGLLRGLPGTAEPAEHADLLAECVLGLVRRRLGRHDGIRPGTRRRLHLARVREVIRRNLGDPAFDLEAAARAAGVSPRYVHQLFAGTGVTPMRLVKRMRLEESRRRLTDPALAAVPVAAIAAACGYRRGDQFARDFRQAFGVAPSALRNAGG